MKFPVKKRYDFKEEETGRRFCLGKLYNTRSLESKSAVRNIGGRMDRSKKGWTWSQETFDKRLKENPNLIIWNKNGIPNYKIYLDNYKGETIKDLWTDIILHAEDRERLNYSTQKPEKLIKRIVESCTDEGDIVLDCFAGSGTTASMCSKLKRKFITGDVNSDSIIMTSERLQKQGFNAFDILKINH